MCSSLFFAVLGVAVQGQAFKVYLRKRRQGSPVGLELCSQLKQAAKVSLEASGRSRDVPQFLIGPNPGLHAAPGDAAGSAVRALP